MNKVIYMPVTDDFERKKNLQASVWTAVVTGSVLLMIILVKWSIPAKVEPPQEEYVEINIGSSDMGSGNDQPLLPGDPAPAQQTSYTPPEPTPAHEEAVKDASTEETDHEAAPVLKPVTSRPEATKINEEARTTPKAKPVTQPVAVVAPPKPRAVMGRTMGGNGNGGNGADDFKPGTGQGVAGGQGDQGRPGGSPNGTAYTGTPRSFGVKVFSLPAQSFQDDFNQNGKVAMEVVTNGDGKVVSATYTSRGSTGTATPSMIDIARRHAFELKGIGPNMKGTVIFSLKVN